MHDPFCFERWRKSGTEQIISPRTDRALPRLPEIRQTLPPRRPCLIGDAYTFGGGNGKRCEHTHKPPIVNNAVRYTWKILSVNAVSS